MSRKVMSPHACALACILVLGAAVPRADAQTTGTSAAPAPASQPPSRAHASTTEDEDEAATVSEVTVTGHKPVYSKMIGAVVGDIEPEVMLGPSEVQSYGVSTVNDLLNELAPQTRSDRGRGGSAPVVLLNGRRISSLSEVRDIPTEAILRVDILPEEVSLKYGYTADQRVVNIVLRRRFHATTVEGQGGGPTEGGEVTGQAEVDLLHIRRDTRLNLDVKYQGASGITDADRDIIEPTPRSPFDLIGNVTSTTPGAQIDPALSALVGQPVTIAGVPPNAGLHALTLGDFVPNAGVANVTDVGPDRSLTPATQSLTANAVLAHPMPWGVNATVNATFGATSSDSLRGLPGLGLTVPGGDPFSPFGPAVLVDRYVDSPLRQYTDGWTAHLGSTLNKDHGDWRLSLTDAWDHADTQTDTDAGVNPAPLQSLLDAKSTTFNPFGPLPPGLVSYLPQMHARSVSDAANIQVLVNGPVLKLPAGNLYVSAKAGDTQSWQSSTSQLGGVFQSTYLTRNDGAGQLNIDLPLASRRKHFLSFAGEFSINANAAVDQISDFGTLKAFGYGLNWTPVPGYNLIISHTNDQVAPTVQQLGAPVIFTPGVAVFDYLTNQTVDVTQITGGQPGLQHDNRNVTKIGLTLKPFSSQDFTFTANYIRSDVDQAIITLPAASAAIQAAFPASFIRDAEGELVAEDLRPVNVTWTKRSELRWGINFSRPIGKQPPPRPSFRGFAGANGPGRRPPGDASISGDGSAPDNPPGPSPDSAGSGPSGGYGGRGGGGGGGGRGGFGRFTGAPPTGGRLQFALYHTIYFTDSMLPQSTGPSLDLLDGAPASATGGQYRNEIEAQLGVTDAGFGARLSADWRQATFVTGSPPIGNLSFSDITTLNLRLFDDFRQQRAMVKRLPLLRGTRISFYVSNLLDQRIQVRDALGATPLAYQPGYIDPAGRTIVLSLRKLFY